MKLNIGSYSIVFPGWLNIDYRNDPWLYNHAHSHGCAFVSMDVTGGLPFADSSVDFIHCSHMIEHITFREAEKFMVSCRRILKPGGVMRLAVPSLALMVAMYQGGTLKQLDAINEPCKNAKYDTERFWELLFAGHKALYDWDSMRDLCQAAEFSKVEHKAYNVGNPIFLRETKDVFPECSLYVECTK